MPESAAPQRPRPLSPHLQIYKPQLTSITSILHRATGIVLSFGAVAMAWWLFAMAHGESYYDFVAGIFASPIGWLALLGWALCFYYHLLNGIRHLLWDTGYGLDLPTTYTTGRAVLIGSAVLTVLTTLFAIVG
jgi:succinate dehydrogenase / fumarate reductase cytochrome b subunit